MAHWKIRTVRSVEIHLILSKCHLIIKPNNQLFRSSRANCDPFFTLFGLETCPNPLSVVPFGPGKVVVFGLKVARFSSTEPLFRALWLRKGETLSFPNT